MGEVVYLSDLRDEILKRRIFRMLPHLDDEDRGLTLDEILTRLGNDPDRKHVASIIDSMWCDDENLLPIVDVEASTQRWVRID